MEDDQREVSILLKKLFYPPLILLGLVGNVVSIIIFSKPSMKKYTTFRYLMFISILDLGTLFTGSGPMLLQTFFDLDIRNLNEITCKVSSFIVYFFTHSSSMLLALMSIDRTVAITIKLGKRFSTPSTALKLFIITSIIFFLLNSHFLLFTNLLDAVNLTNTTVTNCSYLVAASSSSSSSSSSAYGGDRNLNYGNINSNNNNNLQQTQPITLSANQRLTILNESNCTFQIESNETYKFCYAREGTFYFQYLTNYFIW